jgi:hypothetical protein
VQQLVVASGACLIHSDLLPQLSELLCAGGSGTDSAAGAGGAASTIGGGGASDKLAGEAASTVQRLRQQHAAMLAAVNPPLLSFSWVQARRALDAAAACGNAEAGLQQLLTCAGGARCSLPAAMLTLPPLAACAVPVLVLCRYACACSC